MLAEKVAGRVRVGPDTGCWEWQGAKNDRGYGQVYADGKLHYTHRVIFAHYHRPLRGGEMVLHSCDNPGCCNPEHLSAGTQLDNMRDCRSKGRNASGERNGRAKLDAQAAEQVRVLYATGEYTQAELGRQFGINQSQVSYIVTGRYWKH